MTPCNRAIFTICLQLDQRATERKRELSGQQGRFQTVLLKVWSYGGHWHLLVTSKPKVALKFLFIFYAVVIHSILLEKYIYMKGKELPSDVSLVCFIKILLQKLLIHSKTVTTQIPELCSLFNILYIKKYAFNFPRPTFRNGGHVLSAIKYFILFSLNLFSFSGRLVFRFYY